MKKDVIRAFVGGLAILIAAGTSIPAQGADASGNKKMETSASGDGPETVGASTCLSCHDEQANLFKESLHGRKMAAKKGVDFERSCETCHGPGSLHAAAAGDRTDPGFATIKRPDALKGEAANAACLSCHKNGMQFGWKGSAHEMNEVACASCHQVHRKDGAGVKSLLKEDETALCFRCHTDKKGQMKKQGHMPVKEGAIQCSSCHNVHGTNMGKNLKGESITDACYKCHAEKRGPFLWEHPPVRENCLNCHDPHGSRNDKMLVAKQPYLCERCHTLGGHPGTLYDGTSLADRNQRIFAHGCLNCHPTIHGSNHLSGNRFYR